MEEVPWPASGRCVPGALRRIANPLVDLRVHGAGVIAGRSVVGEVAASEQVGCGTDVARHAAHPRATHLLRLDKRGREHRFPALPAAAPPAPLEEPPLPAATPPAPPVPPAPPSEVVPQAGMIIPTPKTT